MASASEALKRIQVFTPMGRLVRTLYPARPTYTFDLPGGIYIYPYGDRPRSEDGEAAGSISSFYHSISNMDYTVCICSQLFVMRHDDERLVHLVS